jgi:phosphatidate cytidylyltransferase
VVGFVDKAVDPNLIFLFIGGIIIAIISQIGDLIMSVIKRHYGIKDYGKIFPGHGGMLDRMDSVFSVALGMQAIIMITHLTGISLF